MKKIIHAFTLAIALCLLSGGAMAGEPKYALLKLKGSVNPVMAKFLAESIERAPKEGASFIVIQMDTPGGLMDSMRSIIQAILASPLPVVVYTYPKGAQAASAGGFIMISAHVAVMAPGTEIGAMHPVSPQLDFMKRDQKGDPAGVMEKKVLNDTVAYARSLAQKRGRNLDWTEKAVTEAVSSTYLEAVKLNVIDFTAEDMDDLMKKLDGRKIDVNGVMVTLKTAGAVALEYRMDWKNSLLNRFADPQMMFLLFIIAVVGIGMEFKNPGMIVPGSLGALSFLIFLMTMQVIPVNALGLILITLAVILFVLELKLMSYGLLTLAGIGSFIHGSLILFDSPLPGGHIPMTSIIAAVLFILGFIFLVVRVILNAHREKVTTGSEGMVGESGYAIMDFTGRGKMLVRGELWNALCDVPVLKDDQLEILEVRGMDLVVRKK
jgi:membrane-bound serine protease (ClpP class)